MNIDIKKIKDLAKIVRDFELSSVQILSDGSEIKLERKTLVVEQAPVASMLQQPPNSSVVFSHVDAEKAEPSEPDSNYEVIPSPMVGTFYSSPTPDSDSYVKVGDVIDEDSVICIVEAMKVMNEIKAERKGRVVEVLSESGQPVEYGQPLFKLSAS